MKSRRYISKRNTSIRGIRETMNERARRQNLSGFTWKSADSCKVAVLIRNGFNCLIKKKKRSFRAFYSAKSRYRRQNLNFSRH